MSNSIPLKEIFGFLPYGLKWNLPLTSERYESILENECYGIIELPWAIENNYPNAEDYLKMTFTQKEPFIAFEDNKLFLGQMKCSLGWEEDDVFMEEMLPVMHPLSDLTKEITHNGETFDPYEYFEELEDVNYFEDNYWMQKLFKHEEGDIIDLDLVPYGALQKLFEWHFDVFDWIKDGLAVDINTL